MFASIGHPCEIDEIEDLCSGSLMTAGMGGESTFKSKVREVLPAALVAVTVYVRNALGEVGVPEIKPVDVLKESPGAFEIAGEIEKLSMGPPVEEMEYPVIDVPCTPEIELVEIVNAGATGFTVIVKVPVAVLVAFVAVIV